MSKKCTRPQTILASLYWFLKSIWLENKVWKRSIRFSIMDVAIKANINETAMALAMSHMPNWYGERITISQNSHVRCAKRAFPFPPIHLRCASTFVAFTGESFSWKSFCITKIWSVSQEGRSHQSRIFSIFVSSNLIWRFLSFYKIFVVYSRFAQATRNGQQKNGAAKDWPKINGIFWFVSMMLRFSGWLKAIKNNIYMQLMLKYSF